MMSSRDRFYRTTSAAYASGGVAAMLVAMDGLIRSFDEAYAAHARRERAADAARRAAQVVQLRQAFVDAVELRETIREEIADPDTDPADLPVLRREFNAASSAVVAANNALADVGGGS